MGFSSVKDVDLIQYNLKSVSILSYYWLFFGGKKHIESIMLCYNSLAKHARFCEPGVVTFSRRHFLFLCQRTSRRQSGENCWCSRQSRILTLFSLISQQYSTNENPSLSRRNFLANLMHGHSDSSWSGSSLPEITEQRIFHVSFYYEEIRLKCIINCIYPSWLNF